MADQALPVFAGDASPPASWASAIKICWLITWRATVGTAATCLAIYIPVVIIGLMLHWSPVARTIVIYTISVIVGLAWRVVAVRMALYKRYSDFRLTLSRSP